MRVACEGRWGWVPVEVAGCADPDRMRELKRISQWVFYENGCIFCSLNSLVTGTNDFVTAILQNQCRCMQEHIT